MSDELQFDRLNCQEFGMRMGNYWFKILSGGAISTDISWRLPQAKPTTGIQFLMVNSDGYMFHTGSVNLPSGNITLTSGNLILTDGDVSASAGNVRLHVGNLTLDSGDVTATSGDVTLSAGRVSVTDRIGSASGASSDQASAAAIILKPEYRSTAGGHTGTGAGVADADRHVIEKHDYIHLHNVATASTANAGASASIHDACVFYFNAEAGVHMALAPSTADGSVGAGDMGGAGATLHFNMGPTAATNLRLRGWMLIDVNDSIAYIPYFHT